MLNIIFTGIFILLYNLQNCRSWLLIHRKSHHALCQPYLANSLTSTQSWPIVSGFLKEYLFPRRAQSANVPLHTSGRTAQSFTCIPYTLHKLLRWETHTFHVAPVRSTVSNTAAYKQINDLCFDGSQFESERLTVILDRT